MSNAKTVVKRKKGDWRIAVLFLLPSLILLGLFVFWPMVDSIHMSFYDWNPLKGKIFTGLENYQNLLKDKLWWTSLGNTIKYILMNVPPIVIFSIIMCELVLFANNKSEVISKFIRGSFFLPCALSLVATGVAWRYLMGTNYGVINNFLSVLGFEKIGWLTDGKIALGSMAIVTIWRWAGYYMVMVVAGRLEISQEFFEAADLDGANAWHKFVYITLPQLKPVLTYIILMCVIGTFQECDKNGNIVYNDISRMIINSYKKYHFANPKLQVRISAKHPDEFLMQVGELAGMGLNVLSVFNDDVIIPANQKQGKSLEDCRLYVAGGCQEICLSNEVNSRAYTYLNLVQMLNGSLYPEYWNDVFKRDHEYGSIDDRKGFEEI